MWHILNAWLIGWALDTCMGLLVHVVLIYNINKFVLLYRIHDTIIRMYYENNCQ